MFLCGSGISFCRTRALFAVNLNWLARARAGGAGRAGRGDGSYIIIQLGFFGCLTTLGWTPVCLILYFYAVQCFDWGRDHYVYVVRPPSRRAAFIFVLCSDCATDRRRWGLQSHLTLCVLN